MIRLNPHFHKLSPHYLFSQIEKKVAEVKNNYPAIPFLNLGIGDITQPLAPSIVQAMVEATQKLADPLHRRGYGPSQGYAFLRETIVKHEYAHLAIDPEEVFIADGAKCHLAALPDLFASDTYVALCDPTYPVYLDSSVMAGWSDTLSSEGRYKGIYYLPLLEENQFLPLPPSERVDLIYLGSPNNPTGTSIPRFLLQEWICYAQRQKALILWDGAYCDFITSDAPRSIYEIPGAKEVAIEIRSFSKMAGFTGLRCSYSIVPKQIQVEGYSLHSFWKRRVETKFGGVSYPIQVGAHAIYSELGQKQIRAQLQAYQKRALLLKEGLKQLGFSVWGGVDAPYVWVKAPFSLSSWDFFHLLLEKTQVIAIPGKGFGPQGEGYIRLSAFAPEISILQALDRIKNLSKEYLIAKSVKLV